VPRVVRSTQHIPDTGTFAVTSTNDPPGVAVRGDFAPACVDRFVKAVRDAAIEQPRGGLSLDCAELHTVSIEGLHAILDVAVDLSRAGRTLTVRHLSPYFHRIFRLADWDATAGLILDLPAAPRRGGRTRTTAA
jgi:anti-anti-sigma regulatory factor